MSSTITLCLRGRLLKRLAISQEHSVTVAAGTGRLGVTARVVVVSQLLWVNPGFDATTNDEPLKPASSPRSQLEPSRDLRRGRIWAERAAGDTSRKPEYNLRGSSDTPNCN